MSTLTESQNQKLILNNYNKGDLRLFRNNVGMLKNEKGTYVHYGLHNGSHDLIGIKKVKITPDMVGKTIGVFVSIEIKKSGWKPPTPKNKKSYEKFKGQKNWMDFVNKFGGESWFCDNAEILPYKF